MGRRAAHLAPARRQTERAGREGVWEAIRKLGRFTVRALENRTRESQTMIRSYVQGLVHAGYVAPEPDSDAGDRSTTYRLVRDVGVDAPRVREDGTEVTQGRPREQMWRTMKIINEFSPRDLAIQASTEECPVAESDAKHYVRYLQRAGYLVMVDPGKPGVQARYRFLKSRNTGPKPPIIQRVRQVYDPNLQQVVWPGGDS